MTDQGSVGKPIKQMVLINITTFSSSVFIPIPHNMVIISLTSPFPPPASLHIIGKLLGFRSAVSLDSSEASIKLDCQPTSPALYFVLSGCIFLYLQRQSIDRATILTHNFDASLNNKNTFKWLREKTLLFKYITP